MGSPESGVAEVNDVVHTVMLDCYLTTSVASCVPIHRLARANENKQDRDVGVIF